MENWQFWAMACGILLVVAVTLLQALRQTDQPDTGASLNVYRDQLAEVDRDLARGVISAPEAERLRTEVSRRLLDADHAAQSASPLRKTAALPAAVAILAALGAALFAYTRLGAPGYSDLPLTTRLAMAEENYLGRPSQEAAEAAAPQPAPVQLDAQFADLMSQLRAVVKTRPDDIQGLELLAKNEAQAGDFIAARKAFEHLVAVKGAKATPEDHMGLAQTMIIAAGGFVSPEAEQHLVLTLEQDPQNGLARYYSGLMFAQTGRFDRTFGLWEPLLRQGPADAPWMEPIKAGLQDVADRAGIKYQMAPEKGPNQTDIANAAQMSDTDRQAMIQGMVGQLESRLYADGGPLADWLKLMSSLMVLKETDRAKTAYERAAKAFAGDTPALGKIESAASDAGITP